MISLTIDLTSLFINTRINQHDEVRTMVECLIADCYRKDSRFKGLVEVVNSPTNEQLRSIQHYPTFSSYVSKHIQHEICGGPEKFFNLLKQVCRGKREVVWVQLEWSIPQTALTIRTLKVKEKALTGSMRNAVMVVLDITTTQKTVRESLESLRQEVHPGDFPPSTIRLQINELEELWWRWLVDTHHPHLYNDISDHLDARILLHFDSNLESLEQVHTELYVSGVYETIQKLPNDYHYLEVHLSGSALFLIMSKNDFKEDFSE